MRPALALALAVAFAAPAAAQAPPVNAAEDVIYHRRDGHALTMDVFTPKQNANGLGVIVCVSAGFESSKKLLELAGPIVTKDLLERGYVVFAVLHSSMPKYTVPEIVEDMHRAVRFVKANAKAYKIDPAKLGITGASSGGHLSLMMGCDGRPGNPKAEDLVERESSRVAAVACFFPPTDFVYFDRDKLPLKQEPFRALFDIREPDPKTKKLEPITRERRRELGRQCSPLFCATKDAVPTFIIHGDEDDLVPLQQSVDLIDKLKKCDVACQLEIKKGMGHSFPAAIKYLPDLGEWFDAQLRGKK